VFSAHHRGHPRQALVLLVCISPRVRMADVRAAIMLDTIPGSLLDWMEPLEVSSYVIEERAEISAHYL
jgi:hypothetical protein